MTEHDVFVAGEDPASMVRAVIETALGMAFRPSQDSEPVPALAVGATKVFFHDDNPYEDDADFPVSRYRYWVSVEDSGRDEGRGSKPYVQTAIAHRDGTHSDWTVPVQLATLNSTSSDTCLLPHADPDGVVCTPLISYDAENGGCCADIVMDYSKDGGVTWNGPFVAASDVRVPPLTGAG
jgi:hypothetical protein